MSGTFDKNSFQNGIFHVEFGTQPRKVNVGRARAGTVQSGSPRSINIKTIKNKNAED